MSELADALAEIVALTHEEKGRLARQINKIAFSALAQEAARRCSSRAEFGNIGADGVQS